MGWRGDDPLIIQKSIKDVTIHRMYINAGSSADIINKHCFCLLSDRWKESLKPTKSQLTGFTGDILQPLITIHFPFTLTSHDRVKKNTTLIYFVMIRHRTEHNIILGRTTLLIFKVVPSTMHGIIKFSTTQGSGTVLATPPRELRCYEIMQPKEIIQEKKKSRVEPASGKKIINREYLDQPVSVGSNLSFATRQTLIKFLKKYKHVFSWTPTDMVRVDRKVIEHKLMIKPSTK